MAAGDPSLQLCTRHHLSNQSHSHPTLLHSAQLLAQALVITHLDSCYSLQASTTKHPPGPATHPKHCNPFLSSTSTNSPSLFPSHIPAADCLWLVHTKLKTLVLSCYKAVKGCALPSLQAMVQLYTAACALRFATNGHWSSLYPVSTILPRIVEMTSRNPVAG